MREIYLDTSNELEAKVAELKWIDMEKGQMNSSRPSVVFPAALISVIVPRSENITRLKQAADVMVIVRLCFDFTGKTSTAVPAIEREKSLKFFDLEEKVYKTLQGFGSDNMNPLERVSAVEEVRPDDYKVLQMTFKTGYRDDRASN